jgi:hypothetical protein
MSGTHAAPAEQGPESRQRSRVFGPGNGRHRRTPENWKRLEGENVRLRAERDQAREERDTARHKREETLLDTQRLVKAAAAQSQRLKSALAEISRLQALLGTDKDNPVNQTTHSFVMPERPRDENDPVEISTQPIRMVELLGDEDGDKTPPRNPKPTVKIYPFPEMPPMPKDAPAVPDTDTPELPTAVIPIDRGQPSESVQSTTEARLMALWEAPFAQPRRVA